MYRGRDHGTVHALRVDVQLMRRLLVLALVLIAARAGADCQLGDYAPGAIVDCAFTTATSIPTTLSGSPVVSLYCSNSATETTTGVTLDVDYDGRTGLNHLRIDTTGYASGQECQMVITTGTIGGATAVSYVVGGFSLGRGVTVTTNSDKTGYSLTQAFPSNFSALSITGAGLVDVTQTAADKVWGSATRTLTACAFCLTAGQVANAVWDEPTASHVTAGTTGKKLGDIPTSGSSLTAADVWTYTSRTLTAFAFGTDITVSNPVAEDGDLTIVPGTAYKATPHSLGLSFVYASAMPDLTSATPTLRIYDGDTVVTDGVITLAIAGTVTGAGTASQTVSFDMTAAQTALLTRIGADAYQHHVDVVWAADSPAQPYRLIEGSVTTRARY
jgi:hypothetical protein